MRTNKMHHLSSIYFSQPVHVSGIFIAHRREVFTAYVQQLVRVIRTAAGRVRMDRFYPDPASSLLSKRVTRTNCCAYTVNTS
jgi:hypothetical protein